MSDLAAVAQDAVTAALAAGASDAEAWAERSTNREVRVYDGSVESLSDAGASGIGLRVFAGARCGYAFTTDFDAEAIVATAQRALVLARVADEDPDAGLPDAPAAAPAPGLRSPDMAGWSTQSKVELALAVERAASSSPGVTQVEQVVYSDAEGDVAAANSDGFAGAYSATRAFAWASAFAGEGDELMTGLGVGLGRGPEELDAEAIGAEAGRRARALVGARPPRSGSRAVVLDPFVAASFLGFIGGMLSADAVQRGRSLFAGRLGEQVAGSALSLFDDGRAADGPASAPFDGEGSPTRRTPLLEAGRLTAYLHDSRTARRDGTATTANARRGSYRAAPTVGPTNLVVEPGEGSLEQLLAAAGNGLYVTDVSGLHSGVNPVSGSFSVGASGLSIEAGELAEPVRETTIASDLLTMLRGVRMVGRDARWVPFGGAVKAGALLIDEMAISGS